MTTSHNNKELLKKLRKKESLNLSKAFEEKESVTSEEYEDKKREIDISFRKIILSIFEKVLNKCVLPFVIAVYFFFILIFLVVAGYLYNIKTDIAKLQDVITNSIIYILLSSVSYLYGKLRK